MVDRHWVFVRHGQSVANAEGWLSGWKDVALTEKGEQEALEAGRFLQDQPFARCLVSDLTRARQTARLVLGGRVLPVHVLPELRERRLGDFVGEKTAVLKADGRHAQFLAPWTIAPPNGESHQEAVGRVLACLRFWDVGGPTLVVGHGGWIRDLLALLDGIPVEEIGQRPPARNAHPEVRQILAWPTHT